MKLADQLEIVSNVKLSLYTRRKSGNLLLIDTIETENTITNNGHIYIADQLATRRQPLMRYMAVGTMSGGKSASSNALEAEIARVMMSTWDNLGTNSITYIGLFVEGVGTGTLVEAGIFNDPLVGNMMCWADYAGIVKGALNILQIEWTHNY